MTKVKMPDPVGYLYQCGKKPELTELRFDPHQRGLISVGYKPSPLITIEQAEAYAQARVDDALEALSHVRQYGSDTLSGRTDGPDDRKWQRDAVLKMTNIAAKAIRAIKEQA